MFVVDLVSKIGGRLEKGPACGHTNGFKSQVARSLEYSIVQVFGIQNKVGSEDAQQLYTV